MSNIKAAKCDNYVDKHRLPYALYSDETLIGFAMIGAYNAEEKYIWLDRFMIDEIFQGKGHSKPLLNKLLMMIKEKWNPDIIVLSIDPTNEKALYLYEKIGFRINGMIDPNNGEKLMEYKA
ncbi:GNAT family N-acetyltransferase [Amphibacillus indicireducens]|uniref:N-acetyltransferase domain-containing protein n=1 Tax=Amphibacillus indicireducens TaxID=1076330 RepID=A0ABP7VNW3_9BACI